MTPIQTFGQAQAPSNMMFPTAAFLQSSQIADETRRRGMEAMTKGISEGIGSITQGYLQSKAMKSEIGSAEKGYDIFKSFMPPELRNKIDSQVEAMNNDPDLSLKDKAAFWKDTKSMLGNFMSQAFDMEKQKSQLDAAMAREREQIAGNQSQPFYNAAAQAAFNTDFGLQKSSDYGRGRAPGQVSLNDVGPVSFFGHQ